MMSGIVVALIFPMLVIPSLGTSQNLWIIAMGCLSAISLPLVLVEYYFTKERVTAESAGQEEQKIPLRLQIKAIFTDKYLMILLVYFLLYTVTSSLKTTALPYFCNYILGTYNDGITQTLVSVIGGIPMGIGIFAVWPLAKKFGKKNLTVVGFVIFSLGSLICCLAPTNMPTVLVGQFVKNMGSLPSAYVFMALFSDALDHMEWKNGFRCDGLAMSVYSTITTAVAGVVTGIFNGALSGAGYLAPHIAANSEELQTVLDFIASQGWTTQIDPALLKPLTDGSYTVALIQPEAVTTVLVLFFLGLEVVSGLVYAGMLSFITVEKTVDKKLVIIRARQRAAVEASGEVWIEPEVRAAEEQKQMDAEAEEAYRKELKERCEKKRLNYEAELAKHVEALRVKEEKQAEKERLSKIKAEEKAKKAAEKQAQKLAKLTPEQKQKRDARRLAQEKKDEARWQTEKAKGEAYYEKMQKALAAAEVK